MGTQKLQAITPPTPLTDSTSRGNSSTILIGQYDNSAVLAPMVDVGLAPVFSSGPTPGAGIVVGLYLVPYVNSTNAGTVNTSGPVMPSGTFAGNFEITTSGTSPFLVLQGLQLSALKYDVYIFNQSGQSITSMTVTFNPTDWQY